MTADGGSEVEHVDVLVVGAGLSGIAAGHHLQTTAPWASYAIFEARDAIGGTWDLFRYPGIRSDSDMFTLGYPWRPWPGDQPIGDGASILQYIRDTAADEGIDAHIRFRHKVLSADWVTEDGRWHVTAERTDTGETFQLTCGFLLSCSGYYRYDRGYQPDFPGLDRYQGTFVHPQHWPEDLDTAGKRIVVIGSGATAVTLIPSLADTAEHVTMLQRSPSYVAAMPQRGSPVGALRKVLPGRAAQPVVRWGHALGTQAFYTFCRKRPEAAKRILRKQVEAQLPEGYDVDTHFTPSYDPWDQRLCLAPDGDLFTAIRQGRASVVTDHVDTFTETGIRLRSGEELEADVVVSATGLEMLFIGGIQLAVDGEAVDLPERLAYKGMMLSDVPNFAMAVGYTNASWTLKCDLTCDYVARLLNVLAARGCRQVTPRPASEDVQPEPLLGLSSGYVQRARDRFPKQGDRFPWRVHQSYLRDWWVLKRTPIEGEDLVLSNPVPSPPVGDDGVRTVPEPVAVG